MQHTFEVHEQSCVQEGERYRSKGFKCIPTKRLWSDEDCISCSHVALRGNLQGVRGDFFWRCASAEVYSLPGTICFRCSSFVPAVAVCSHFLRCFDCLPLLLALPPISPEFPLFPPNFPNLSHFPIFPNFPISLILSLFIAVFNKNYHHILSTTRVSDLEKISIQQTSHSSLYSS